MPLLSSCDFSRTFAHLMPRYHIADALALDRYRGLAEQLARLGIYKAPAMQGNDSAGSLRWRDRSRAGRSDEKRIRRRRQGGSL
jgi:hypothetical protein